MIDLSLKTFILLLLPMFGYSQGHLSVTPRSGDGLSRLLARYKLPYNECNVKRFKELNKTRSAELKLNTEYKIPVREYVYNGTSIRSTIKKYDYDNAVRIQDYNDALTREKVKEGDYRIDKKLWVAEEACGKITSKKASSSSSSSSSSSDSNVKEKQKTDGYAIFGEDYRKIEKESNKLKGQVYYLVSGHGGPDPGAIGKKDGKLLCEDEYAYDVVLRLARHLISNGALVHLIVKDADDGIRDNYYLDVDHDETVNGKKIPLQQISRLSQRTLYINKLYKKYKSKGYKKQYAIMIHIDSRSVKKEIDVFFYHNERSTVGKKIANKLYDKFKENYEKYQKGRGYEGSVSTRNLYLLNNTNPPAVYIELGNIQNQRDHRRILNYENREALAKWLYEGLSN